jgi:hypothetical protein
MGQLFLRQRQNCQTCGKPMVMASPPLGTGAWTLRCLECDPLRDDKALGPRANYSHQSRAPIKAHLTTNRKPRRSEV